jgi:hypothetical protein
LQQEYWFIGYPLYIAILTAAICGLGTGMLQYYRRIESLVSDLQRVQRKLTLTALWSLVLLAILATVPVVATSFTLR